MRHTCTVQVLSIILLKTHYCRCFLLPIVLHCLQRIYLDIGLCLRSTKYV